MVKRFRSDDDVIQRFCGEPGMPAAHSFSGGSCIYCPTTDAAWSADRVFRAVCEERDQLRQKVADLEEVRGELLERLDGVERARLIEAKQRLAERRRLARQQQYRAFRDR